MNCIGLKVEQRQQNKWLANLKNRLIQMMQSEQQKTPENLKSTSVTFGTKKQSNILTEDPGEKTESW